MATRSGQPSDRRPLIISGPSGVGKGTLFGLLTERHPDTFAFAVSHTTRAPRPGEVDGRHYHFVSRDDFQSLIDRDSFVEWATFGGNAYGTSKATIAEQESKGKIVVLDIEMEGIKQIRAAGLPARFVFIAPPSQEILERRLRSRGTDKEESIIRRLAKAKEELEFSRTAGVHDLIIFNDDLETAYRELENFVYQPLEGT